ncbi:brca1 c terminus domain-containing protein [Rutstroemia sp. NJR-2017a BVV2]|nr:brca1 c terminus domain-containing protein [Rutstroemia sp. NJR-2017a BVV2]PQE21916.1 brca1 c terminus domain-containing protein [Rutstroemia sp. NJR-2017a BVV2]
MADPNQTPIFDGCVIAIVVSGQLPKSQALDIAGIVEGNGAIVQEIKADMDMNLEEITHIVSSTTDFAAFPAASLQMVPVVKPSWVSVSLSKNKLAQIRPHTPDERLIFSNVVLTCADIPQGDKDAIIGCTLAMGGMESNSLTKLVTHICALSMDHPKCLSAKEKNLRCKIVLPHWFDDCLKLGKRIDETPYLLPNPEIFHKKPEDAMPIPSSTGLEGATGPKPEIANLTPTKFRIERELDVFKNKDPDNTHLITARKSSEKCSAAEEWNIDMVNHLWLEESYAKCEIQRLTDPRYTHFPPRTNLAEVIGQTQFDHKALKQKYFPRDPIPEPGDPKPRKKPLIVDQVMSGTADAEETNGMAPPRKSKGRRVSSNLLATPANKNRTSLGKENDTPSSTGSRSAKDKAINAIHDLAPDLALYEKEKKRKGHVFGGDRAANKVEKERSLQRSSSPTHKDSDTEEVEVRPNKKQKVATRTTEIQVRMLVTGYTVWQTEPNKEDTDTKKLRNLGIAIWKNSGKVDYMAAPKMVRTRKFLVGLAHGPIIVSDNYIEACIKAGKMLDVEDFPLKDPENEKKHGVKLKDAVARARTNKGRLLAGVPIYSTADIENGFETYKDIAEVNSATFGVYKGRPVIKPTKPEEDDGPPEPVYLITGEKKSEKDLWPKFTDMAKAGNMEPRIVKVEWLLDVAMSQQMKWDKKYLHKA